MIRKNGNVFEIDMKDVSELWWMLGFCQGLREGFGSEDGQRALSPEDLAPIENRLKAILVGDKK